MSLPRPRKPQGLGGWLPSSTSYERVRVATVRAHYLAGVECDHETQRDRPMCACSRVDLGWHPNVGLAVDAWVRHVVEADRG